MLINLLEIPAEGKTFVCNRNTSELNASLDDLIGNTPYTAEFTIRQLQPATYELVGSIKTEIPEDCSRCGLDFKMPIDERFRELLIPEQEVPRNSKFAKANHVSDMSGGGPDVVEYQGHHFNAGEFIHEVVGLAEPFTPAPPCNSKGECTLCKKLIPDEKFSYEDPGFETPTSPFGALKNIKLN